MTPPVQWYNTRQNNSWPPNVRPTGAPFFPPKPQPPQHFPQWTAKVQHSTGYQQMYNQNNQYMHHTQAKSTQNEPKSEMKNITSFVPLQAQKKSRNIIAKDNSQPVIQDTKKEPSAVVT